MPYDLSDCLDDHIPNCKDCYITLLVKKVTFDGSSYYATMYQCPKCKDISFTNEDE